MLLIFLWKLMSKLSQVMLKPIWLFNKLFYVKGHLNIQLFMKIFKIKNIQKLEEWLDKALRNWLNKEQSPIKFWKEWLTLTIDSMYLVKF